MKILLVSEEMTVRPNEGTLVFLMHLGSYLQREADLTIAYARGEGLPGARALRIAAPKIVLTRRLAALARGERFDAIVYVPQSGLTAYGLGRASLLRLVSRRPVVVIGLQDRPVGAGHRMLGRAGPVDLVLSPVASVREALERAGVEADFIMPGFDERVFRPVSPDARARLRAKYDLPRNRFLLLHVGHIRESRNLEVFLRYRDWGSDVQPLIKAGDVDPPWADRLRMAGVIVIDEYVHAVHELYQAADCYFFPVGNRMGAVEFPLSVIEACACNLPVVATRFGILPEMLREGPGYRYYDRVSEIAERIAAVRGEIPANASKVADCTWRVVFRDHLMPHLRALARAGGTEASA